jgi:inorganic pyrophosphatase
MARLDKLSYDDPESESLIAVIETPRGSRNKYDYDPDLKLFRLAAVLPEGTVFPYDFGFFPSTKAADGDPLDVLVLLDERLQVRSFPFAWSAAIEAEQRKKGEAWVRNDRLLAVATHAHTHSDLESIKDINPKTLDEIEAFFEHYNP